MSYLHPLLISLSNHQHAICTRFLTISPSRAEVRIIKAGY